MAKIIKEIDWNGHHYTFTNEFHRTGTKSHDVLTMEDENGNTWTGETTWINRPWHRFDLEEAFNEIVSKAFGPKALELVYEINKNAHSVENAIDSFFSQFKAEDIQANEVTHYDSSEEARINALAKYLEVSADIIESIGDNEFEVDGESYKVLTDDEADEEFENYCRSLWEDVGLDGLGYLADSILEYALDESEVEDLVRDDMYSQVEWMSDEEVIDDCISEGLVEEDEVYNEEGDLVDDIDIDDLRDQLVERKFEEVDDYAEFLRDSGYDDDTLSAYIDEDKAVEAIMDAEDVNGDGRGAISGYDGVEIDLDNGLYAYRTN